MQKPPKGYKNPSEASFTPPSGKFFHDYLQKVRVVLLVYLAPNLLTEQRIAFFGENVYILYVTEMTQNFRVLLLICTPEHPEKVLISICRTKPLRGSLALFLQRHSILA
jgi:hypothetical protein